AQVQQLESELAEARKQLAAAQASWQAEQDAANKRLSDAQLAHGEQAQRLQAAHAAHADLQAANTKLSEAANRSDADRKAQVQQLESELAEARKQLAASQASWQAEQDA